MAPTPIQVLAAVKATGARYVLSDGWDDPHIAAPGAWDPSYVIMHHTANGGAVGNAPSLNYCVRGTYPPVRNCHFLIGRDGTIFVVHALGCYHAGRGGPGSWGNGPMVAADTMNHYAFGIEIESEGSSLTVTPVNGYTSAQVRSSAALAVALVDLMKHNDGVVINHKTWAPGRKNDTLLSDAQWHAKMAARRAELHPAPSPWASGAVYLAKLHYGQTNSDSVKRLQYRLNVTRHAGLAVDGNYGLATDLAVRQQQKALFGTADAAGHSFVGPKQAAVLFPHPPYTVYP